MAAICFVMLFLFAYGIKCRMGISLSNRISLSSHFPFNYLARKPVITASKSGLVFHEDFESRSFFPVWSSVRKKEKGLVSGAYVEGGRESDHSFHIKSQSESWWAVAHKPYVAVKKGEVYVLEEWARVSGRNARSSLMVSAFDAKRHVVKWNYASAETGDTNGQWVRFSKEFKIEDGVHYLRFRFGGRGVGQVWVDGIKMVKGEGVKAKGDGVSSLR